MLEQGHGACALALLRCVEGTQSRDIARRHAELRAGEHEDQRQYRVEGDPERALKIPVLPPEDEQRAPGQQEEQPDAAEPEQHDRAAEVALKRSDGRDRAAEAERPQRGDFARPGPIGALLIGLAEQFGLAYAPTYSVVFTFVIMFVALAFRPRGIMGKAG